MLKTCELCGELLKEGDTVECKIRSTYHVLKSSIAYALDRNNMEVITPLRHQDCRSAGD